MSYIDLAVLVLGGLVLLILVYLAILTRQIALLHLRLQPTGARITDVGPDIGAQLDPLVAQDIHGNQVRLIGDHRARLLLFVSPTCAACQNLMPAVKAIARGYRRGDDAHEVVLITMSEDRDANMEYMHRHGLSRIPYVMSATVAEEFRVWGSPYAVVINADGVVTMKGIVNNVEHLESLLLTPLISLDGQISAVAGRAS